MNEDTLVLYYYKDGLSERERRQVEAAINADSAVAAQYETLCRQLNDMSEADVPAVPSHTVQRWHDTIDRAAQQTHNRQQRARSFNPFSFAWGAAIATALAIGIGINIANIETDGITVAPLAVPAAFTRGVQVHFRDTYQELSVLPIGSTADRIALILQIIDQNRLFERAAEQNDSQGLARVLRAFEPILLRLAADDIAPEEVEALRAQLAFELNVMLTKLARKPSTEAQTT